MPTEAPSPNNRGTIDVDLRQPAVAAFWAWFWPGAGHLYQGRHAKGVLFMVCILSTYFFGLSLGGGHVVYASWTKTDKRWQYFCQLGVGLPALPAIVQNRLVMNGSAPLFGGLMAPPAQPVRPEEKDELAQWHEKYHSLFELGMLYTMIAGLLNVLAIYDAFAGPAAGPQEEKAPEREKEADKQRAKRPAGKAKQQAGSAVGDGG
jgi:TM2 domain-containing membrane protein YozV